jgi:manganese-dependent ADP-ribose/CDP-alcohol diphosphatase
MPRYYRHALEVTRHAAQHFESEKLSLVINLGDIIDGKCQSIEKNGGEPHDSPDTDPGVHAADEVIEALSAYTGPVLHAYGNHCLYNLDRPTLQKKLGIPFVKEPCGDLVGYSSYSHNGVRFVTIDSYDIAKMQRSEVNSVKRKEAVAILLKNNPNYLVSFSCCLCCVSVMLCCCLVLVTNIQDHNRRMKTRPKGSWVFRNVSSHSMEQLALSN